MSKLALHGGRPVRQTPYPPWPVSGPREEELVRNVLFSEQWGGYHPYVAELETLFAHLHDATHGVALANGSVALEVALQALDIGQGDEVIVPAHSFIATASAVTRVGATPVFVDIERETFNLDLAEVEAAMSDKAKAVIAVHFGGLLVDMDRMAKTIEKTGLDLIEDAAHAHGAEWMGQRAGGMGSVGTFSFQNSKSMTAGEGGMVITSDEELAARMRSLINCGRRPEGGWFDHFEPATNLRLTGLQAAVLMAQLERLPDQIRVRQNNRALLEERLTAPGLHMQALPDGATLHTHYILPGWVDENAFGASRDELVAALNAEGVPIRPFYPHPLYRNPLYRTSPCRVTKCPVAEQAVKDSFWLPQRVLMGSEEDTLDIVRAIDKVFEAYKPRTKRVQ
ncbi:MAG: DegT/DnrJ/EryC1/StrS family aminotransferase [Acidobacteria bacterium]|nr:DegT/DnrJ/EryC1/StrS family aminotransferase [Acidobacteriota bacterium]